MCEFKKRIADIGAVEHTSPFHKREKERKEDKVENN